MPVVVANDSHAAALAELTFFRRPRPNNLIVIKVGRGVGAGIILNGQLFQGDGYGAGEFGHVSMSGADAPCRCGQAGLPRDDGEHAGAGRRRGRRRAVDHRRARPRGRLPGRRHRHPADRPRCRARARCRDRLADRRAQRSPRAAGRPGRGSSATTGSARSGGTPGRASWHCSHATRRSSSATSTTMSSSWARRRCSWSSSSAWRWSDDRDPRAGARRAAGRRRRRRRHEDARSSSPTDRDRILYEHAAPTDRSALVDQIAGLVDDARRHLRQDVAAVAVAIPGHVDPDGRLGQHGRQPGHHPPAARIDAAGGARRPGLRRA